MAMFLRIEDRLDGISNHAIWQNKIQAVFEEAAVWDIVRQRVVPPTTADELVEFTKNNAKAKKDFDGQFEGSCGSSGERKLICTSDVDNSNHSLSEYQ